MTFVDPPVQGRLVVSAAVWADWQELLRRDGPPSPSRSLPMLDVALRSVQIVGGVTAHLSRACLFPPVEFDFRALAVGEVSLSRGTS